MGSRAKKKPGDEYICPKCGTDVMVTGFTLVSEKLRSYMRFAGRGAVRIATRKPTSANAPVTTPIHVSISAR